MIKHVLEANGQHLFLLPRLEEMDIHTPYIEMYAAVVKKKIQA